MTNIDLQSEPQANSIQEGLEEKENQNDFSPDLANEEYLEEAELIEGDEIRSEEEFSKSSKS